MQTEVRITFEDTYRTIEFEMPSTMVLPRIGESVWFDFNDREIINITHEFDVSIGKHRMRIDCK